jgi:hypothetical protein
MDHENSARNFHVKKTMHTVPTPNMTGTIMSSTRYSFNRWLLSFLLLTMLLMVDFISCIWRKLYVQRPKLQIQSPTNWIVFFRRNASYERASSYNRANMKRPRNDWRRSGPSVLPSSLRLFHKLIRIQLGCYQSRDPVTHPKTLTFQLRLSRRSR